MLKIMKHSAKALTVIAIAAALAASACGAQSRSAENPTQVQLAEPEISNQVDSGVRVAIPETIPAIEPPTDPPTTTTTVQPTTTTTTPSPEPQTTATTNSQCNEVEVYNPSLAQRGIKGTNGQILTHREMDTSVITDPLLTQPWFDWQPAKYENEIWYLGTSSGGIGGGDLQQVVRFQGSAAGCIPVCFWTDTNRNALAEPGEFYFNYNTHPTTGIGPAPHHQGRLLRTPTQLFLRGHGYPLHEVPLTLAANYSGYPIAAQSDLHLFSEIAGVRVAADDQSCVAYDANGSEIPAPQATPSPYKLAQQLVFGAFDFLGTDYQVNDCPYTDSPSCKMYTYTRADEPGFERNQILSQGFLDSGPGFICNQHMRNYQASLSDPENLSCYIFPYTHER